MGKQVVRISDPAKIHDACGMYPVREGFANRLNTLLEEKEWKPADLAGIIGVGNATVTRWKNGEATPKVEEIVKTAEAFGVDCHYLLTGVKAESYMVANDLGLSERALEVIRNEPFAVLALNFLFEDYKFLDYLKEIVDLADIATDYSQIFDILGRVSGGLSKDVADRVIDFIVFLDRERDFKKYKLSKLTESIANNIFPLRYETTKEQEKAYQKAYDDMYSTPRKLADDEKEMIEKILAERKGKL